MEKKIIYFEIFAIFLFFFLYYSIRVGNIFIYDISMGFDFQNLLIWEYAALLKQVPYRDVSVYYGLLYYYKNYFLAVNILYYCVPPLLMVSLFRFIYRVTQSRLLSYSLLLFVFGIVERYMGMYTLNRYGLTIILCLCMLNILFPTYSYKRLVICGVMIGLYSFMIVDQSIIVLLSTVGIVTVEELLKQYSGRNWSFRNITKKFVMLLIGVLIGLVPFIIFLVKNKLGVDFLKFWQNLGQLSLYAKVPYTNDKPSFITISLLLITILLVLSKLTISRKLKPNLNTMTQILLTGLCIIMEQKNILRTISEQLLIFVPLFVMTWCRDLYEIKNGWWLDKKERSSYLSILILVIVILAGLAPTLTQTVLITRANVANVLAGNIKPRLSDSSLRKQLSQFVSQNKSTSNPRVQQFYQIAQEHKLISGSIYAYPDDPVYYILYKQIPPKYLTTYDTTPEFTQQDTINYLEKMRVKHIIYNTTSYIIQDGVPNLIRNPLLHRYILNNYHISSLVNNYIVFDRNVGSDRNDIFKSNILDQIPTFKNYLTEINLGNIPYTEGFYKYHLVNESKPLISGTVSEVNKYLINHSTNSSGLLVIINHQIKSGYMPSSLLITVQPDITTSIRYFVGDGQNYIIDLDRIPLFYESRHISNLALTSRSSKVTLVKRPKGDNFW